MLQAPPPEGEEGMPTQKPMSDSGGFITGLLKTILSGSSGGNMMRVKLKKKSFLF